MSSSFSLNVDGTTTSVIALHRIKKVNYLKVIYFLCLTFESILILTSFCFLLSLSRKSTFDMFNFLASQHRQLPDIGPYDDEEDEVLLKSTRSGFIHLVVYFSFG